MDYKKSCCRPLINTKLMKIITMKIAWECKANYCIQILTEKQCRKKEGIISSPLTERTNENVTATPKSI